MADHLDKGTQRLLDNKKKKTQRKMRKDERAYKSRSGGMGQKKERHILSVPTAEDDDIVRKRGVTEKRRKWGTIEAARAEPSSWMLRKGKSGGKLDESCISLQRKRPLLI